mgnify:CR=1 FL=1
MRFFGRRFGVVLLSVVLVTATNLAVGQGAGGAGEPTDPVRDIQTYGGEQPGGVHAASAPNDPFYGAQWNLLPVGSGNAGSANVEPAWDIARGAGVKVAILDTGVRIGGPDLDAARVIPGYDFVNDDPFPDDDNGQGTFTAGIVAQSMGNGLGTAGVAPEAFIMPVKVLGHHGVGSDQRLTDGMLWARDHGADVILVSLNHSEPATPYTSAVCETVHEVSKTVPIVAAAGDTEGGALEYPAACDTPELRDSILAVGAVNKAGLVSKFSAADPEVDITAPGGDHLLDSAGDPIDILDPILAESYQEFLSFFSFQLSEGASTTFAAAHVAGAAALVRGISRFVDVEGILIASSRDLPDPIANDFGPPTTTTLPPTTTTGPSGPSGPSGPTTTTTTLPPPPLFNNRGVDAYTAVLYALGGAPTVGYRMVAGDGGVFVFGESRFFGSMGGRRLNRPMVGIDTTPSDAGYWTVASDGGIFSFGDAGFFGSTGGMRLFRPIVGMAATPSGKGYWLFASDGGVFAYGDAKYLGGMGGKPLAKPIVGMAVNLTGKGYWLVAEDGGIFAFGDAKFFGSMGGIPLAQPIVGMAALPSGLGYWMVGRDGGIFTFGDAKFYGGANTKGPKFPITGMAGAKAGNGYWIVAQDGTVFPFGSVPFFGPTLSLGLFEEVVAIVPS